MGIKNWLVQEQKLKRKESINVELQLAIKAKCYQIYNRKEIRFKKFSSSKVPLKNLAMWQRIVV